MSPIIIYYKPLSTMSRSVIWLVKYLDMTEIEFHNMATLSEIKRAEFPSNAGTIMNDNGFTLTQSRAIMAYLINSKLPESSLYPKDPKARGLVDARLYYEACTLYPSISEVVKGVYYRGETEIDEKSKESLYGAFEILNGFMKNSKWVAADELTIADFALASNIGLFFHMKAPMQRFPEIVRWYDKCKELLSFKETDDGTEELAKQLTNSLKKGF